MGTGASGAQFATSGREGYASGRKSSALRIPPQPVAPCRYSYASYVVCFQMESISVYYRKDGSVIIKIEAGQSGYSRRNLPFAAKTANEEIGA
jgi:hypothetical protein